MVMATELESTESQNIVGSFSLEKTIIQGNHGHVYSASVISTVYDLQPGEKVTLKILYPEMISDPNLELRIQREVELGMAVQSPHVARTYGIESSFDKDGRSCIAVIMEFIDGTSIAEQLESGRRFSSQECVDLGRQLCSALQDIHSLHAVHRDIKPENLLLTRMNRLVLLDLGLAKLLDQNMSITMEGTFVGSWAYSSPEQVTGIGRIGPPADLYATGVVLYEIATGTNPFRSDDLMEAALVHLELEPEDPGLLNHALSRAFRKLIMRLLSKRIEDRPQTAQEVLKLLESC